MNRRRALLASAFLVPVLVLAASAPAAQKSKVRNAPENCPWCHNDPQLMAAAGVASHGGFEFGVHDDKWVDKRFAGKDVYWIATPHFELGLCLTTHRVGPDESKKIRAELAELAQFLPDVDPKTRVLEPFMRAHLYALRVEKTWKRFLELMQVKESDFPDGKTQWILGTPYFGEGPFVGEKGKFEVLVLPTAQDQLVFLTEQFGLAVKRTQRWNVVDRDSLIIVTNLTENDLSSDERIHGHLVFNLAINLIDAFKHYSYDTPCWLREGLGHMLEREINPRFNSFDASEGSNGVRVSTWNWDNEVKQLVTAGKAPRVAELTALRTYAEFEMRHHYACWSMTRFMVETDPAGYACLNGKLHGRKTAEGLPDDEDLPSAQRALFQECFGMSYAEFDQAWSAWAITRE